MGEFENAVHNAVITTVGGGCGGGRTSSVTEDWCICDASASVDYTSAEVYDELDIGTLVNDLVTGGNGGPLRKPEVLFYDHLRKEVIVHHKQIRGLKKESEKLGNDIVDFVHSQIYMQMDLSRRRQVHVISLRASTAVWNSVFHDQLARDWLLPPNRVRVEDV